MLKKLFTKCLIVIMATVFLGIPFGTLAKSGNATLINNQGTKKVVQIGSSVSNFYTGILGYHLQTNLLGAVVNQTPALFETSLAAAINSSATSMTLVSGKDRSGNNLSGNYCFTIDSGLNTAEYVCGTASSTSITSMTRGVGADGVTSITALKYAHRYGADVKITDFPVLQQFGRILNGQDSLPGGVKFGTNTIDMGSNGSIINLATPNASATTSAANVQYVNNITVAGAPNASSVSKGVTYLSSNPASSTLPIALNSEEVATTTGANKVVRSGSGGVINSNFIDQTANYSFSGSNTFSGNNNFIGTTTIATTSMSVNPIVIATGSFSKSGTGTSTTLTHNLGVVPYLIEFNFTSSYNYGSSYTGDGIGSGHFTNSTSTVESVSFTDFNPGGRQVINDNSHIIAVEGYSSGSWHTPLYGSIQSVSTSTVSLLFSGGESQLTAFVNWRAYGIRK